MPHRHAIYFAPDPARPLWQRAVEWHGRDPLDERTFETPLPGIDRAELAANSVSARRYGFHATIKSPMRLAAGSLPSELESALAGFAAGHAPIAIGRLKLALIDDFLALVPVAQSDALTAFAGEVVEAFERFRELPSADERARRLAGGKLTPRQVELLDRFGYPYVMEQFQFHMTLTDRLPAADQARFMAAAAAYFGPLLEAEMALDRLVLFHEPEAGAPFRRGADYVLSGKAGA